MKDTAPALDHNAATRFISPAALAARWNLSRSGAVRIADRAGLRSFYLGKAKRGTRRFLLTDVIAYEESTCAGS